MWHGHVSELNRAAGLMLRQFDDAYSHHPAIMVGFAAVLVTLCAWPLLEAARVGASEPADERPIRLRR